MSRKPRHTGPDKHIGTLRIIGGQWRSRKLQFTEVEGLRPTGDRIRETLFNWLAMEIAGARCLDLFAGSGALGLEALSRDASHCDFVELNRAAARQIQQHLQTLNAVNGTVHCTAAADFLADGHKQGYDIIFLDPPFNKALLAEILPALAKQLNQNGLVYLEQAKGENIALPANWQQIKQKTAGEVVYSLWAING